MVFMWIRFWSGVNVSHRCRFRNLDRSPFYNWKMDVASAASRAKFDVREDEDQSVRLQDSIDLLVAAGYFRARIKGLSPFDKIVGGMVWCISVCNYTVDVDLLYAENSTIGQKIALTEKIVEVLPRLSCPHTIEPHQIQGLDFIHIFPVIQWLVKHAMEAKKEAGDDLEAYVDHQYKRITGESPNDLCRRVDRLSTSIVPVRRYKRGPSVKPENLRQDLLCTMAEYSDSSSTRPSGSTVEDGEAETLEMEDSNLRNRVSTKLLREIIASVPAAPSIPGVALSPKDAMGSLDRQIQQAELELSRLDEELAKESESRQQTAEQLAELEQERTRRDGLKAAVTEEELKELRDLYEEYEQTAGRERAFRAACRKELAEMDKEIEILRGSQSAGEGKSGLVVELERELAAVEEELVAERLEAAEVSRKVVSMQRQLDSVPSQIEMAQYQQRFIELYNQMASKHSQTKQYYTLHNTLIDVRNYMQKEIDLLNKIEAVLPQAKQESFRDSFIQQLQTILRGVETNHEKIKSRSTELEQRKSELTAEYSKLKDSARAFQRVTEEFQKECERNEELRKLLVEQEEAQR